MSKKSKKIYRKSLRATSGHYNRNGASDVARALMFVPFAPVSIFRRMRREIPETAFAVGIPADFHSSLCIRRDIILAQYKASVGVNA